MMIIFVGMAGGMGWESYINLKNVKGRSHRKLLRVGIKLFVKEIKIFQNDSVPYLIYHQEYLIFHWKRNTISMSQCMCISYSFLTWQLTNSINPSNSCEARFATRIFISTNLLVSNLSSHVRINIWLHYVLDVTVFLFKKDEPWHAKVKGKDVTLKSVTAKNSSGKEK